MKDLTRRQKLYQNQDATIRDVLKFRTALRFMHESHLFGGAFGPAGNRNECIESAHKIFYRLNNLSSPKKAALPYRILELAAISDNELIEGDTDRALQKLFQPDSRNELSLLAFVQSIDSVYKKLRFFRASVRNARAIDNVLESIINVVFYFVLGIFLLSVVHINTWSLLLSLSSLLVSFSFAMGPSVSKYVEVRHTWHTDLGWLHREPKI
jgi:hypothetical protein